VPTSLRAKSLRRLTRVSRAENGSGRNQIGMLRMPAGHADAVRPDRAISGIHVAALRLSPAGVARINIDRRAATPVQIVLELTHERAPISGPGRTRPRSSC
jgi:hypothetical protein